jgi:small subunit ribosomal protein S6
VKRYEGLFILNTAGKEESLKDIIDQLSTEINAAGGRVETVQKMDKRNFSRVADKRVSSGFYVNVIFESQPAAIAQLQSRFALNEDVYRVMFSSAPTPKAVEAK